MKPRPSTSLHPWSSTARPSASWRRGVVRRRDPRCRLGPTIDDETFAAIERAYSDHAVIFFRDQHITRPYGSELGFSRKALCPAAQIVRGRRVEIDDRRPVSRLQSKPGSNAQRRADHAAQR
jgi:hypothetical protein